MLIQLVMAAIRNKPLSF